MEQKPKSPSFAPAAKPRKPEFGVWEAEGYRLPDNFNDPDPEIEALFYGDDEDVK